MKNFIFVLISMLALSTMASAQTSRSTKTSTNNPRVERKMAITSEGGWKTTVGTGIIGSFYVAPQFAVDAGFGLSTQGLRGGVRGRYLLSDKNFSPIIGLGLNISNGTFETNHTQVVEPFEIDGQMYDGFTANINLELKRTIAAQFLTGFEYMADQGFVVGFTIGYRARLNDSWDTEFMFNDLTFDVADNIINGLDRVYGSGISIGLNLGYAF